MGCDDMKDDIEARIISENRGDSYGSVANAVQADLVRCIVTRKRPALFRGRHFEDVIILLCVRWYLRYSLTYRDL